MEHERWLNWRTVGGTTLVILFTLFGFTATRLWAQVDTCCAKATALDREVAVTQERLKHIEKTVDHIASGVQQLIERPPRE